MYGRWVDVYDKYGKLWQHVLVGDKSFVKTGVPNRNTIEFYNALRRDVPTGVVRLRLSPVQRRATKEEIEAYHRRHIDQMTHDLEEVVYRRNRSAFDGATAT